MLAEWIDLFSSIKNTVLIDNKDTVCWNYDPKGVYTVKSFNKIVNFRGIHPGDLLTIWNIEVPLRIHIFLWLMAKNKLLTRDNLQKRQTVDDATCLFCSDPKSIEHLFFGCVVAIELWRVIFDISNKNTGMSVDDMLAWWFNNKNHPADCLLHSAVLWTLWKYRNDICFNHVPWLGMLVLWRKTAYTLGSWMVRCSGPVKERVMCLVRNLEQEARAPPLLMWPDPG